MQEYVNRPFKKPRMVGREPFNNISSKIEWNKNELTLPMNSNSNIQPSQRKEKSCEKTYAPLNKFFTVNVRKVSSKKNKTWNSDGYAYLMDDNKIKFYDDSGNSLGSMMLNDRDLFETIWRIGSNECQIDYEITEMEELEMAKLTCRIKGTKTEIPKNLKFVSPVSSVPVTKHLTSTKRVISKFKSPTIAEIQSVEQNSENQYKRIKKQVQQSIKALPDSQTSINSKCSYFPLFDPASIPNALVMNKPAGAKVDVVVDPMLVKHLRPHQREGVKFLYDCVMGLSHKTGDRSLVLEVDFNIKGCLLADEMGLGKTLMTITVLWTLLKQTPFPTTSSRNGMPLEGVASKILIVCPVTLINNWKKEFKKWLPVNRIGVLTLNPKNTINENIAQVKNFLHVPKTYQVLILGYERLLTIGDILMTGKDKLDLLICDEGHRLKNRDSKVLKILSSLEIEKKIVLSGTPIQNDLEEFFTVIDFINPGILGSFARFKKEYIIPIQKARDIGMKFSTKILEKGQAKSEELIDITKKFILRRTNEILTEYLPPKTDLIIFCKPTEDQIETFKNVLSQGSFNFNNMTYSSSLGLITLFKKICNSTSLIHSDQFFDKHFTSNNSSLGQEKRSSSGKLLFLEAILDEIKSGTDEKVVVVSNYTKTLDIIESHCHSNGYSFVRLDGSIPTKERDQRINSFNKDKSIFLFLLSAKSGGVGLNLIGASRLILFDNDWNPSVDLQAMSRIHRDGQKRPCFIYRLITTGCIDEKILQRQLMKIALSKKFLDDDRFNSSSNEDDLFDRKELADIFTVNTTTRCGTHDLICTCTGEGIEFEENDCKQYGRKKLPVIDETSWINALEAKNIMEMNEVNLKKDETSLMKKCLIGYKHIDPMLTRDLIDDITTNVMNRFENLITYAFIKDDK